MKLEDFIKQFSHNNPIYIENKERVQMYYKSIENGSEQTGSIMDWELKFTNIAQCEVIKLANVFRRGKPQGFTIVIDTDKDEFEYIPELITRDNAPLGLYNDAHKTNIQGCIMNN